MSEEWWFAMISAGGKYISQHIVKARRIQFVQFSLFKDIPFNRKGRQGSVVSGTVSRFRDTRNCFEWQYIAIP